MAATHPGYFRLVEALCIVHLALGLDAHRILPDRTPVFTVVYDILDGEVWVLGGAHLLIAVLLVVGLYVKGAFELVRVGGILSAAIFNVLAVSFAFSSYAYNLSYFSAVVSVGLSLLSVVVAREPEEPGSER